jgi:hypothetical protein
MMQVQLDQITFDFDPERSAKEPLSFFRETEPRTFPARESGTSFASNDFVVTYVRSERAAPEIRIKLSSPDSILERAEIQAIADKANVLGNVPARWIDFDRSGKTDEITLTFPSSTLEEGVQCNAVAWEWQYRRKENENWIPFQTTQHRVYCIVGNPTFPWDTTFSEEVAQQACNWAKGAKGEVGAATKITEAVFALGLQVSYAPGPTYAKDRFNYEGFLEFLRNGTGASQSLNCDDCATIVSTFGNILGCDLEQSEMGSYFDTNFIRRIGDQGWVLTTFDRHAVAWKFPCDMNAPLYDACLQIDADGCPSKPGHRPLQPTNLRFGSGKPAENEYKFCLVSDNTSQPCDPVPGLKQRRLLGISYLAQHRVKDPSYLKVLADRYNFESFFDGERLNIVVPKPPLETFVEGHPAFDGWKRLQANKFTDDDLEAVDEIVLLFPDKDPAQMVELNVYICAEGTSPKKFFLQLFAQFNNSIEISRADSDLIGAVVFASQDQTMHLVMYHQLLGLVRSVGKKPISTTRMEKAIEDYFVSLRADDETSLGSPTSTPSKTRDQQITGEFNMPHKLATTWTCHLPFPAGTPGLKHRGDMDLRDMGQDGRITTGRYYLPDGGFNKLVGEATGGTPVFFLTLREFNDAGRPIATYTASLVHENATGTVLMLAGKRHDETTGLATTAAAAPDQNDPPWVITKP